MRVLDGRRRFLAGLIGLPVAVGAIAAWGRQARAAVGGTVHEVEIRSFRFRPARLTVQSGDEVVWTNLDLAPHTVTATDGSYDSGELKRNQSWRLAIEADTSSDYFCVFHPHMKGVIERS